MWRGILCSLWFLFAFGAPAATAQIEVRLPVTGVSPGESVRLPVTVSPLGGSAIHAYEFTIRYAPDILDLQGAELAGTMSSNGMQIANTSKPGEFRFALATATQLGGDGPLLILKGKAGKEGTTALRFESLQFNEGTPAALAVDGFLKVGSEADPANSESEPTSGEAGPTNGNAEADPTSPPR